MRRVVGFFDRLRLWHMTPDEVIAYYHYDELKRRLDNGLDPSSTTLGRPMLLSAVSRLKEENYEQMCPIICLLMLYGADLTIVPRGNKAKAPCPAIIVWLSYFWCYNQSLVNLAVILGADFSSSDNEEAVVAQQEVRGDRGKVYRLLQRGDQYLEKKMHPEAAREYQEAISLLTNFHKEEASALERQAGSKDIPLKDRTHRAIVDAYHNLLVKTDSKLNACWKALEAQASNGDSAKYKCH